MKGREYSADEYWITTGPTDKTAYKKRLGISPELDGLAVLCEWDASQGSPVDFYRQELNYCEKKPGGFLDAAGTVGLFWSIEIEDGGTWLSPYPNETGRTWYDQGFSHPVNVRTGRPAYWYALPMVHRFPEFWAELGYTPAPFATRMEVFEAIICGPNATQGHI